MDNGNWLKQFIINTGEQLVHFYYQPSCFCLRLLHNLKILFLNINPV